MLLAGLLYLFILVVKWIGISWWLCLDNRLPLRLCHISWREVGGWFVFGGSVETQGLIECLVRWSVVLDGIIIVNIVLADWLVIVPRLIWLVLADNSLIICSMGDSTWELSLRLRWSHIWTILSELNMALVFPDVGVVNILVVSDAFSVLYVCRNQGWTLLFLLLTLSLVSRLVSTFLHFAYWLVRHHPRVHWQVIFLRGLVLTFSSWILTQRLVVNPHRRTVIFLQDVIRFILQLRIQRKRRWLTIDNCYTWSQFTCVYTRWKLFSRSLKRWFLINVITHFWVTVKVRTHWWKCVIPSCRHRNVRWFYCGRIYRCICWKGLVSSELLDWLDKRLTVNWLGLSNMYGLCMYCGVIVLDLWLIPW